MKKKDKVEFWLYVLLVLFLLALGIGLLSLKIWFIVTVVKWLM